MARLAHGDTSALAKLVRRHQGHVLQIAIRCTGDATLAEDIGQETFLRVWRSANSYEPTAQFTTWLYRIVVNLCLDAGKKRKASASEPSERADTLGIRPEAAAELRDRSALVRAAVEQLADRQRLALILHRFSGLSIREVSCVTGWSEPAVESLLGRAYASLRQWLRNVSVE